MSTELMGQLKAAKQQLVERFEEEQRECGRLMLRLAQVQMRVEKGELPAIEECKAICDAEYELLGDCEITSFLELLFDEQALEALEREEETTDATSTAGSKS